MIPRLFLILTCFILTSCQQGIHVSNGFQKEQLRHRKIAVLPVEVIYAGENKYKLSKDQLLQISLEESKRFQVSMHDVLRANKKVSRLKVSFQSPKRTNGILRRHDLTTQDIWNTSPDKLADLLKVDAIVISRIEKKRYLSLDTDNANSGEIYADVSDFRSPIHVPTQLYREKDVIVSVSLFNGTDGALLFTIAKPIKTDWSDTEDEIINHVSGKILKRLPL